MPNPPMPTPRLSACLIVQDEARRLPQALASLAFCDEVVVVDGGSRDETVALARGSGAKVIENSWPGFAAQRNVALAAAGGEWVLEVDADERVSPALRADIESLLSQPPDGVDVAVFPLRHRFLGGLLGPSAKYPAYRTRLFRRGSYEHDESRHVHEGIEPRERPAVLVGDLEHELADTLAEAMRDAWRYAQLESAHISPPRSPRAYLLGIALRPTAKLLYRLVLDAGWRDGWRGLLKVGLDAGSDALVWVLVLAGGLRGNRPTGTGPESDEHAGNHFGRRPTGPPKVVALARRGRAEARAREWLEALAAGGVDVALVSNCALTERRGERGEPAGQSVSRLTPPQAMRALDVEMQIRSAHAVVPFGARARLLARLLPGSLRPSIAGVDASTEPQRALGLLHAAVGG
ncbi:MAG TPA: glycosyltransferase family 2 protein [Solirubrobacteraceae bacterium]|nr:glycosyltransferase family 2 protein [Solirubrobacteraceae bacterium]